MKLWQMDSILQGNRRLPSAVAASNEAWKSLKAFFDDMHNLQENGNREALDTDLPSEFVCAVLAQSGLNYYLTNDGWLRYTRGSPDDKVLSALDAFGRYGGQALEEALEYGSFKVV